MFKLKRPCNNCPFTLGHGSLFRLRRVQSIADGPAFQCHKTVDYSDDDEPAPGDKPQQCAGLMAVLLNEGKPNQIMQVAERLGHFKPDEVERAGCYQSIADARRAHEEGVEP